MSAFTSANFGPEGAKVLLSVRVSQSAWVDGSSVHPEASLLDRNATLKGLFSRGAESEASFASLHSQSFALKRGLSTPVSDGPFAGSQA